MLSSKLVLDDGFYLAFVVYFSALSHVVLFSHGLLCLHVHALLHILLHLCASLMMGTHSCDIRNHYVGILRLLILRCLRCGRLSLLCELLLRCCGLFELRCLGKFWCLCEHLLCEFRLRKLWCLGHCFRCLRHYISFFYKFLCLLLELKHWIVRCESFIYILVYILFLYRLLRCCESDFRFGLNLRLFHFRLLEFRLCLRCCGCYGLLKLWLCIWLLIVYLLVVTLELIRIHVHAALLHHFTNSLQGY